MYTTDHKPISIGGERLINWKLLASALPFIILVTPITENSNGNGWTFWRWTLAAIVGAVVLIFLYLVGDVILFHSRKTRPINSAYVFIYGLFIGAAQGFSTNYTAHLLRLVNEDVTREVLVKTINSGLAGLLLLPLSSLIAASYESYRFDRNQLITERMAAESKKSEGQAIVQGLRTSMSQKMDENLLEILTNSKEFFDQRQRTLDQNWELMAEKLRTAALETIRPFSHTLHKKGREKQYSVKPAEILRYVAHSIVIHIPWVLLIYGVTTYTDIYTHSDLATGSAYLGIRLVIIVLILLLMRFLKNQGYFRTLPSFLFLLTLACSAFALINVKLDDFFGLRYERVWNSVTNAIWLAIVILAVGLISAFIDGQKAELEFIKSQLTSTEVSAILVKREEARVSRELAKYLHGTIQSRLMASAIEVERAGRSGDTKAIKREISKAYKTLKLPDEAYFSAPEENLADELKKVSAKWNDLMVIKISISKGASKLSGIFSQDIGNVINEALANAFRHGEATQVAVKITQSGKNVLVNVSDNGSGPAKGKPGLGSETFTSLAGTSWKLTKLPNNSGTELNLTIKDVFT